MTNTSEKCNIDFPTILYFQEDVNLTVNEINYNNYNTNMTTGFDYQENTSKEMPRKIEKYCDSGFVIANVEGTFGF